MMLIDADAKITVRIYDKEHEETNMVAMTIVDFLDSYTEEGCPVANSGDGWISVKDRLPNCNGCYLVWRPWFYPSKGMPSICYFDGSNTWHDSYGVDFTRMLSENDVTHWMPMPEAPKEENNG